MASTWEKFTNLFVGGKLRMGKGASITVVNSDNTESQINLAELAALDGIAAADLAKIDGITNGTAATGKALVLGGSGEIATITSATITTLTAPTINSTNVDAGASGTAGTVEVFPATAAKGKLAITAADSAGDTTTTIVNASQAAARTYTIPDAGADASLVMTEGAQTINGVKTFANALAASTSVAVGGGTAITKIVVYSQSLDVASVAANTTAEQTFTVTGLTTADKVFVNKPSLNDGLGIVNARVSAADTLALTFVNATAAAIDPAAEAYAIVALRS